MNGTHQIRSLVRQSTPAARGPLAADDQVQSADGPEQLASHPHRRDRPTALGPACHLQVGHAVEADDHRQAREDFRMIQRFHAREPEQPLGVER